MQSSLVVNRSPSELRVALLESGHLTEIYVERSSERGVVGNIYRGRVVRVLPGMQAAFVDIGLERTGFLYVDDALLEVPERDETGGDAETPENGGAGQNVERTHGGFRSAPTVDIATVLTQGQEIVVQVQKDPLGTKGARLTRRITIPGRHLVHMPFSRHVGVSRRIESEEERERLRTLLAPSTAAGGGYIVRTAAEGIDGDKLEREATMLRQIWEDLERRATSGKTPRLVLADLDLGLRTVRDLFSDDVERVVVDTPHDHQRIREFVASFAPEAAGRIELYAGPEPIFDHFGIEVELERALERRVWLKSGGYIVIDEAEALTAIDVNSGRFVGQSSLEDTITQINLEAVKEVAFQLRLRNIGGIVIIDFIDMTEAQNREKVLGAIEEALKHDKAKTTVVRMSEIGLVEMTRKRVRESLRQVLTETCPYCKGRSFIKSEQTVANEILRSLVRALAGSPSPRVLVNMEPTIADCLYAAQTAEVERIEARFGTQVIPVAREGYHREHFEIVQTRGRP